jgi:hypothetical protein
MAFSVAKHKSIYIYIYTHTSIYDVKIFGFTRSSIYIYDISRLRIKKSLHLVQHCEITEEIITTKNRKDV